jgi:[methyl-Co(III) methanol-specific corrinoid protein]:coenzyme M methyltransferase
MSEWMTPKRRFLSGLFGGRVDRLPVGSVTSVATVECMEASGAYFPEAHFDAEKMAKLAATAYDILGYDCLMPYFSVWIEGAAFLETTLQGTMDWGDANRMPDGKNIKFWEEPDQVTIPDDFLERTAPRALLDAINILHHEYGDRVAIVGKVMGPWTLSYHVADTKNILMSVRLNPDRLHGFMEVLKELTVEFGKAQVDAGADVIMLADHATGDLVSAETYRKFLLEVHQEITKRIGAPIVLHICGDTTDRLHYIAQAGFDCFHIDSKVDAYEAKKIVGNKISLMGNINNPETLLYKGPEDVKREAFYAAKAGFEILAPECAIPTRTKNENLKAITEIARNFSKE